MIDSQLTKDTSIIEVVTRLASDLGDNQLTIKDYWDADLRAIGLVNDANPDSLAYISTNNCPEDTYYLELEAVDVANQRSMAARTFEKIGYEELVKLVKSHLAKGT